MPCTSSATDITAVAGGAKREKGWQENSVNYRFLQEGFFERKEVNHWHTHPNLARITAEL
jgi:hypothetical protein